MYKSVHSIATLSVADYIANYRDKERFIACCRECGRYGNCWACPPFGFDTEAYISAYETAFIIVTKIIIEPDAIEANRGRERCAEAGQHIIREVRRDLDKRLLEWETAFTGRAFFAGTCHMCPDGKCARITAAPCIAPDKVRPSLEAFGFDISKTTTQLLQTELKWGTADTLPEYFTLVSGFFTSNGNTSLII